MFAGARASLPSVLDGMGPCPAYAIISLMRVVENLCVRFSSHHIEDFKM
jgi:hypothetical protein